MTDPIFVGKSSKVNQGHCDHMVTHSFEQHVTEMP